MKKNVMMRIAAVLLVCVLVTTCGISGTFAKYTTTASGNDNARVAYWGFNAPASVDFSLFTHGDNAVISAVDGVDLIAPGTSGSATVTLAYAAHGNITAPEVAYSYTFAANITGDQDTITALNNNTNFVWKLGSNEYQTFEQLANAVAALSQDSIAAGALPTTNTVTIGWEWKFVETVEANTADTNMGNATNMESITVTLTITATQLNNYTAPQP